MVKRVKTLAGAIAVFCALATAAPAAADSASGTSPARSVLAGAARGGMKPSFVVSTAVALKKAATTSAAAAATDTWWCWDGITFMGSNGRFVSAELGYSGSSYAELRARATAIGPWEKFGTCIDQNTGWGYLWSDANGLYVSAELSYANPNYGELRARASSVGAWELFWTPTNPGTGSTYFLSNGNRDYVSAELGYSGSSYAELRARATAIGPWEQFSW